MKRLTKAQKEQQQKAALMRRVMDICAGAFCGAVAPDNELFADHICAVMQAVRSLWVKNGENEHLVGCWNVNEYATPAKICEFLWRNGVRA